MPTHVKAMKTVFSAIQGAVRNSRTITQKVASNWKPFMSEISRAINVLGKNRGIPIPEYRGGLGRPRVERTLRYVEPMYKPDSIAAGLYNEIPMQPIKNAFRNSINPQPTGLKNLWKRRIEAQKFMGKWALPAATTTIAASSAARILQGRMPYRNKEGELDMPGLPLV